MKLVHSFIVWVVRVNLCILSIPDAFPVKTFVKIWAISMDKWTVCLEDALTLSMSI